MEPIAVVGLSCLFPGAETPDAFWRNLIAEVDSTSLATPAEMGVDPDIFYDATGQRIDTYRCKRGGYIRDFTFDASGYAIGPQQLHGLDEVSKWSLYVAREALKDSGYLEDKDALESCGVILGNLSFPTRGSNERFLGLYREAVGSALSELLDVPMSLPALTQKTTTASSSFLFEPSPFTPAATVAEGLSLAGTALTLDAACASSLYAVKLACDALLNGQVDLMLAGAVSCADPFFINMGFTSFQAYPDDCVSRPLDRQSSGLIAGEGAGMFVLKRHADALRDGDHVYAVIRGIGLSNDGKGKSLLSPHPKGQRLAYERAYAALDIDPESIDYIECHATGTSLGDQTEIDGLEAFFGQAGDAPLIGSVKSNFGHLLTAAGMASMLKVILSMEHGQIPATIKVADPLESAGRTIGKSQIVHAARPWPEQDRPRRAGVNAFGFGGTNAHLVLEAVNVDPGDSIKPDVHPKDAEASLAIVGMDAHFGAFDGLARFARAIYDGADAMMPPPDQRWKGLETLPQFLSENGLSEGAFITQFDFDFLKFGIPPSELDQPIPQQLLMLKIADRAINDAALKVGDNVAVIVGMDIEQSLHRFRGRCDLVWQVEAALKEQGISLSQTDLDEMIDLAKESVYQPASAVHYTSLIGNIMASRISAHWDFTGPALTLSAMENSTFFALQTAEQLLANGEVDAVVVGAVDLAGSPEAASLYGEADGPYANMRIGEGAGALVVKRPEQARLDCDRIYAVIEALTLVRGNCTDGGPTQRVQEACQRAFAAAKVAPADVGYLEFCGFGLVAQDALEIEGLVRAYGQAEQPATCAVGSVQANVGHTRAASGMASLIKSVLALHQRMIPAQTAWTGPKHPEIWGNRFYVPTDSRPWLNDNSAGSANRLGAIHAIGMDGTAAHVLLAEARTESASRVDPTPSDYLIQTPPFLYLLAGDSHDDLLQQLTDLAQSVSALDDRPDVLLALARHHFASVQKQTDPPYTLALVGEHRDGLLAEIEWAHQGLTQAFAEPGRDWKTPAGSAFTARPLGPAGGVSFVYPGIFNSYMGLGSDLFQLFPHIHAKMDSVTRNPSQLIPSRLLYPRSLDRLSDEQLKGCAARLMADGHAMSESGAVFALLFTDILHGIFGLQPDAAFGYSLGESTMLLALGAWPVREADRRAYRESPLFQTRLGGPKEAVRERWGMSVDDGNPRDLWQIHTLRAPLADVEAAVAQEARVYLTQINTAMEVVIAGEASACDRVIAALACDHVHAPFDLVIHNEAMRSERDEFVRLSSRPVLPVPGVDFHFSADNGAASMTSESVAERISDGLCRQLDFPDLVNRVYQGGARIFVELGSRSTCSRWIGDILAGREHAAMSINHTRLSDRTSLVHLLAQLASHRVAIDLSPLYGKDAEIAAPGRSFVMPITLGGARIADTILTETNRRRFGSLAHLGPVSDANQISHQNRAQIPVATIVEPAAPDLDRDQNGIPKVETHMPPTRPTAIDSGIARPQLDRRNETTEHRQPTALASGVSPLQQQIDALRKQISLVTRSHATMLKLRQASLRQIEQLIRLQAELPSQSATFIPAPDEGQTASNGRQVVGATSIAQPAPVPAPAEPAPVTPPAPSPTPDEPRPTELRPTQPRVEVVWDQNDLLEFAQGDIANVFGPEYAVIDTYTRRVRLPMPPYLLVDRVTKLDAERGVYRPSTMQTEYDIPYNARYAVDGQASTAVTVESGQCDLLLISYIGIDFEAKGELVYRLLDCTLTFLDKLPSEGQTLRYDISINSYARNGDNLLFFFSYNCYANDKLILKMRNGCAGFFSDHDLAQGRGIVITESEIEKLAATPKTHFESLLTCRKSFFDADDLALLSDGDLVACFGQDYALNGRNPSLRFPDPQMVMMDRITEVDASGGPWGLGRLCAEKDLASDDWYFPCHFKDDEVLAGSLMAEGCVQLLQFYMLNLGLHTLTADARFEPIPGLEQAVRCRGQVTPGDTQYRYELEVTEIGLTPQPYVKANVNLILGDKIVVDFRNLGLQLVEKAGATVLPVDSAMNAAVGTEPGQPSLNKQNSMEAARFTEAHIAEFATGSLSRCFGPDFDVYANRRTSRTPSGDLQLMSRVLSVSAERFQFTGGPSLISEYDVPENPWFLPESLPPVVPYSIYMEIGLQPCGFLSAYLGSTLLLQEEDLHFRNLDGTGVLLATPDLRGKTVRNHARLTSSTALHGVIIQEFEYEMSCQGTAFFRGDASFGYFSAQMLADQKGLDGNNPQAPWLENAPMQVESQAQFSMQAPEIRSRYYGSQPARPHWHLPGGQLDALGECTIVANGGRDGMGYIRSQLRVKPDDWFFACHFYQDPVMPGSLGVEAIFQAMKGFAVQQNLGERFRRPYFGHRVEHETRWKYRGQIVPGEEQVELEIHITGVDVTNDHVTVTGDASLWKHGMRIYEVSHVSICISEWSQ